MSVRSTRRLLLWTGWIGLILAFMPFYTSTEQPRPAESPTMPDMTVPLIGDLKASNVSKQTRFTIGLPFSPSFEYKTNLVNEITVNDKPPDNFTITGVDGQSAPKVTFQNFSTRSNFNFSWNLNLFNWSLPLAIGAIALLILARRIRRRSQAMSKPVEMISPDSLS